MVTSWRDLDHCSYLALLGSLGSAQVHESERDAWVLNVFGEDIHFAARSLIAAKLIARALIQTKLQAAIDGLPQE